MKTEKHSLLKETQSKLVTAKNSEIRAGQHSLVQKSQSILWDKYFDSFNFYFSKSINELLVDLQLPHVILFKDYLFYDDDREFLRRYYNGSEFQERHKRLCAIHSNMSFMVRPNLVKHEQNGIMTKRNVRIQKLVASKLALKAEKPQNPVHALQAIPNYNFDVGYSMNVLSETLRSGNSVGSNYRNEGQEGSFLLMLKQYEENMSLFNYEGLINNADYPKYSPELLWPLKKATQQLQKQPVQNDFKKLQLEIEDIPLDSRSISFASSFNAFHMNPDVFLGSQAIDSKGHLLEDSDLHIIYDLTLQAQNNGNKPIKSQNEAESKQLSSLPHKSKEALPAEATDQKVILKNFSKITHDRSKKLSSFKTKIESGKMINTLQFLASAGDTRKKRIKDFDKKVRPSSDNRTAGLNEHITKEQGTNHKVAPTTKLRKIDLSKSPPRNPLLNSPVDDRSLSPEETKRVMTETSVKISEERRHQNQKRDPITTKISLSISPPPAKSEGNVGGNNNKSIIPSIKNMVMKLTSKQSEKLVKKPKENNFMSDRPMENPFLRRYARERGSKTKKVSARDGDSSRQAEHSQEQRPLSTRRSNKRETQTEESFSTVSVFNKHSPRINMEAIAHSRKTPIRIKPIISNHSNTIVKQIDNDAEDYTRVTKSIYKYLEKPVTSSDAFKKHSVIRPSPDITATQQSPHHSIVKTDSSLVKGTVARPNTRGGSMTNHDGLKKSVAADMHARSKLDEESGKGRGKYRAPIKKLQNYQRRVVTEESGDHLSYVNIKQNSLSKEHIKSTQRQLTESANDDGFSNSFISSNKKIELRINLQKMRPKSSGGTAPYTLSTDHNNQTLNTGRSGNTLGEETKAYSRREYERTSKNTQSKATGVSIQNSKKLSLSQSKNSQAVRKSGQSVTKKTESQLDKASELYEQLKGSHHTSNKSVGAYPNNKHQALTEVEMIKRKGLLRKTMKSK